MTAGTERDLVDRWAEQANDALARDYGTAAVVIGMQPAGPPPS